MTKTSLFSLREGYRAAVFGASGGIGRALVNALAGDERCGSIFALSRSPAPAMAPRTRSLRFDLLDDGSIKAAADAISSEAPIDLVIIATGALHIAGSPPEKTWKSLSSQTLLDAFHVNAAGPAIVARHVLDHLPVSGKSVFACLSARVGSISDNRLGGWYAYRASKAALNMLVKTLAIELSRRRPEAVCVSLHPGTVATALSAPFSSAARPGAAPEESAQRLLAVLDRLRAGDSGGFFAYDGQPIDF